METLMSIKPRFAEAILAGEKPAEIRRRFPDLAPGSIVNIYASTPVRAVVGSFRIDRIDRLSCSGIWTRFGGRLAVTRAELRDYLRGCPVGAAIVVRDVELWDRPLALSGLRTEIGIEPAQSYRYLDPSMVHRLRDLTGRVEAEGAPATVVDLQQYSLSRVHAVSVGARCSDGRTQERL